ncbi:uncharacterized protein LOC106081691 [Stomoxys calcitrans]|uniref:RING-type E3 ubiquitin transferase n=1 Tax=Stomoxys calcitrans TaxID=35570 RepID=A0A1I8Q1U1_STOCA|nr:uncharacterized protein LOC106081691 [Stomoxys calcitrans]
MNTIEEISEISETQGEEINGNTKSSIKTKLSSKSTTSTSSSTTGASTQNNSKPQTPNGGLGNGVGVGGAGAAASPTSNGVNTSFSEEFREDLKIIGHLKNIEKLNEKRRVFLTNTISSEYSSDEKTESTTKANSTANQATANGNDTAFSNYNAKKILVREHHIDSSSDVEHHHRTNAAAAAATTPSIASPKYATLPLKTPRTPNTPPPKPPMLSRTRSIGIGDSCSMSSPPPTPKFPPTPQNTPIQDQPDAGTFVTTAMPDTITHTTQHIQPTESTIITSSKITEPLMVTCVQLDPEETATVVLRSSANAKMNGDFGAGFAPEASLKDIPVKHYERLIEELKCPGCAFPMKSPIYLCKTGHSICEQCTRILLLCPLCKEGYTNIRSLTVEALCSKAHFKCSNASGGCTVRLQLDLLSWHEKQCIYKPMKCFMGRVWGDCQWNGREAFWKDHLEAAHSNKVFTKDTVDLVWNMGVKQKPLTGYYVFQVFNEMFNFYEIYDKERILFTMTCTSTQKEKKLQFAYEVTLINEDIEALSVTQKFPVHSEYDSDILAEGTCISFVLSDLTKFLDEEKMLHFRIRILEVKTPRRSRGWRNIGSNGKLPIDFQQTNIEGVNLKNVPSDVIVTRRMDDIPFADTDSIMTAMGGVSSDDEIEKSKREFYEKLEAKKKRDSGSDTDPEFEAFIAKKWGTPQLNFNRKYLKGNATSSDTSSSTDDSPKTSKLPTDDKISITSTSYKKRMTNTLRKSFRSLKSDLIEMKPFGKKSSPEKKLM